MSKPTTQPTWKDLARWKDAANDEALRFRLVTWWAMMLIPVCLLWETYTPTAYGKFASSSSLTVDPRIGWWIMELPCSTVFWYLFWMRGPKHKTNAQLVLGVMFSLHYVYRGWVYPLNLRVSPGGGGFHLPTAMATWLVTVTHAYLNAKWIGKFGPFHDDAHLKSATFWIGFAGYYLGLALIMQHDVIMRSLRSAPGAPRYSIPTGGLFDYAASAQYTSELIAWFFWMTVTGFGPNGWFIFLVSLVNLTPRAVSNYAWYEQKFGDEFTKLNRAKMVPFVW